MFIVIYTMFIMEIGDRIRKVMEFKNMNYRSLGILLDYSDGQTRNIIINKSVPKIDFVQNLLRSFPEINTNWLITGEGTMLDNVVGNQKVTDYSKLDNIELIKHLLERKDELILDETFRDYIRMVMELIMADDEREKKNKALEELKEIAIKKYSKRS